MTQPAAGWFPDQSDPSRLRYFDGRAWTEQYANVGGPPPVPAQPTKPVEKPVDWKLHGAVGAAGRAWTERYASFGEPTPPVSKTAKTGISEGIKFALAAAGILLAVIILVNIGSNSHKKDSAVTTRPESATRSYSTSTREAVAPPVVPAVAPAGSSVRDGKFEFKVLGVERGATSKDGGFGTTDTAKGEYFTVKLQVTNIGDEARTLFASNQKLMINGKTYEATSHITDDGWKEDINPGLASTTTSTFDIPPGALPTAIECHDSAFSGGALLAL